MTTIVYGVASPVNRQHILLLSSYISVLLGLIMLQEASQRSKHRLNKQLVVFEVEGDVYQELRHGFEKWSDSPFPDMFAISQTEGKVLGSAENPIRLSGCTITEFESVLEVMYPSGDIAPGMLKKEEWIGVLKLSRLWDMPRMSAVAIENLSSFNLSPIEKITLGKANAYQVPEWIKEAYTTIIGDSSQMSLETLGSFGWETAARVLWAVKEVCAKSHVHLAASEIVKEILEEEFRVPEEPEREPAFLEPSPSTEPALDFTPFEASASPGPLRTTVTQEQPVPGRAGAAGIISFGVDGVYVLRNTTQGPDLVIRNFAEKEGGWRVDKHVRMVGDTTGSGLSDIIGFGDAGVWISRNLGDGSFGPAKLAVKDFGYDVDAGGWRVSDHVRYAVDLRKKGRVDIIGFGDRGVLVSLNNGNGTFGPVRLALREFGYCAGNWRTDRHLRFLADVTGNGLPDIIGFGETSVLISLNNGDGTFQKAKSVLSDFTYSTGMRWRIGQHPRTVADMTGDGRADIVGFSKDGVSIAFNAGDGTFRPPVTVARDLKSVSGGWGGEYPCFVADLTGDGRGDIIVFGYSGVYAALNKGDGTFQSAYCLLNGFDYRSGWHVSDHLRRLADLTGDGAVDIIGFKEDGVWVAYNDGKGNFGPVQSLPADSFPLYVGDWSLYRTIRWVTNLYG